MWVVWNQFASLINYSGDRTDVSVGLVEINLRIIGRFSAVKVRQGNYSEF